MNLDKLIFVDLETSGFDPEQYEIIQVSAVDCFTGKKFNQYVKFDVKTASRSALETNHYWENEKLWEEKGLTQKEAFHKFQDWLSERMYQVRKRKDGTSFNTCTVAGHNLSGFDINFIREWENMCFGKLDIDYACYDTLYLARWVLPDLESHRLESLCEYYGIETKGLHNSMKDVLCNIKVAYKMLESIGITPKWCKNLL